MQKHSLSVRKTARVFSIGDLETATEIWIVLHGYAQLASSFIESFDTIVTPDRAIIAPEGLHRFYQKGFYGDVVASWMTKEDRLDDINDYVSYLDTVVSTYVKPNQQVTLFGFSQGVATVCRWLAGGKVEPQNIILWAGTFPQDIDLNRTSLKMKTTACYLAFDENDVFRNEESWQKQLTFIDSLGIDPIQYTFEGGHKVPKEVLSAFVATYF